mmetsp:Transcript_22820/g.34584  ORF Transcript_22820/g.34584 Transcript_22820/m.34584 type:complete len:598 (-) Transcript_22820:45-1838(-)
MMMIFRLCNSSNVVVRRRMIPSHIFPLQQKTLRHCRYNNFSAAAPEENVAVVQSGAATIFSTIPKGSRVLEAYTDLTARGLLSQDERQVSVLRELQSVQDSLVGYELQPAPAEQSGKQSSGMFSSWFGSSSSNDNHNRNAQTTTVPQGAYIWGGPGCGKSLCMDLFYHCVDLKSKRRIHFNEFMLDVHQRMHRLKQQKVDNAVSQLALELVKEGYLLCFDEMQITDIADAMIVKRVLGEMLDQGAVCVMTSNRPPKDLYKNGLQRELFVPFITQLEEKCTVVEMVSEKDYRMLTSDGCTANTTYFIIKEGEDATANNNNNNEQQQLEQIFHTLCEPVQPQPTTVRTRAGRRVEVPLAAHGVARFTFDELCNRPLGAADYMVIARAFHTVVVTDIPQMYHHVHYNEARRFIQFVDQLYEHKTNLVCSAQAAPYELYVADPATTTTDTSSNKSFQQRDEQFAFDRCVSRLTEMQSSAYLSAPHLEALTTEEGYLRLEVVKLSEAALQELFTKYDMNGDGVLDTEEIRQLLEDVTEARDGHRNVEEESVSAIFTVMDTDNSGGIDWDEFKNYSAEHGVDRKVEFTSLAEPDPINNNVERQ